MISFIKKNIIIFLLFFIFFLAAGFRFYKLSEFPVGFHLDEAMLGYTGYSLLLTGKDTNNNPYPLYTEVFGENNPTGYHYLTMVPIKFFGLNEFATRFPAAFIGALTIFVSFFLTYAIFQEKKISLLAALLIAISPWHIILSRGSAEASVALFFIMLGVGCVVTSLRTKNTSYLFIGTLIMCLSFLFYPTPRVFISVLYFALLCLLYPLWKKESSQYKVFYIGSFVVVSLVAAFLIVFGGSSRFNQVSIFAFPETKLILEEQIREDGIMHQSIFITRLIHNKIIGYALTFIEHYFEYFSGAFLFIKGGLPFLFSIPQMGLVYFVEFPFLIAGVVFLTIHKRIEYKLPLVWLLLAPVVAAMTFDDIPNVRRAITMVPALEMIAAYGFFSILQYKKILPKRHIFIVCISILLFLNVFYFLHQYFVNASVHKNWYRNEGFGEMIKTVKNSYDGVDSIIVTKSAGGIYPLVLFYMQYDPKVYQAEGSPKDRDYGGFGKFFFVPQACPSQQKDNRFPNGTKIIYIDKGECVDNAANQKIIYRKDGTRVFNMIYE